MGIAVTLVGLLSYLIARYLVDGYLSPFFISFDEVGLDYGKLVASGALFTVPITIFMLLVYRLFDSLWRKIGPRFVRARSDAFKLIAVLLLYVAVAAVLLAVYAFVGFYLGSMPFAASNRSFWVIFSLAALSLIFAFMVRALWFDSQGFLRAHWRRLVQSARAAPEDGLRGAWRVAGGFASILVALILVCASANAVGKSYSAVVKSGQRLSVTFLGLRLPGLAAKPVSVSTISGGPPAGVINPECVLLLGERGESVLLYDHKVRKVFRFSNQTITTTERIDVDQCT